MIKGRDKGEKTGGKKEKNYENSGQWRRVSQPTGAPTACAKNYNIINILWVLPYSYLNPIPPSTLPEQ